MNLAVDSSWHRLQSLCWMYFAELTCRLPSKHSVSFHSTQQCVTEYILKWVGGTVCGVTPLSVPMASFGQTAIALLNMIGGKMSMHLFCWCHFFHDILRSKNGNVVDPPSLQLGWNICSLKPYVSGSHDKWLTLIICLPTLRLMNHSAWTD